jgi:hypothetical protein
MENSRRRRPVDEEFGELLYAKDLSLTPAGLLFRAFCAGLFTCMGLGALVMGGIQEQNLGAGLFGAFMVLVPIPVWYFQAYRKRTNRFRFFEHGLKQTTLAGTRRVAYRDLTTFMYSALRVYVNHIYSHTDVRMDFQPAEGEVVVYHSQDRDEADELDVVRTRVSEVVADRFDRAARDGPVDWCEGLRFLADELEVAPPVVFGKPKPFTIPYQKLDRVVIHKGNATLYETGKSNPLIEVQVLLPNFFPGLARLARVSPVRVADK